MALLAQVKAGVAKAFAVAGEFMVSIDYVRVVPGVYDPVTNTSANTETTYPAVKGLRTGLTKTEVDYFPANRHTFKLIIQGDALPFEPSETDYAMLDGVRWAIKRLKAPPQNVVHVIFLQEP